MNRLINRTDAGRVAAELVLALLLAVWMPLAGAATIPEADKVWRFRVFLDDREIGYHHYFLAGDGETRKLRSVASFEYRLLRVRLYHYEHENVETWSGDCLQSIVSSTDANGRNYSVEGGTAEGVFRVAGSSGAATLPGCVMSFAYWNPSILGQARLLNTQNGEFLEVEVSPPVSDVLEVGGEPRDAWRYRLVAGELNLDLWYSTEHDWLALESEVRGDRTLRYERM